MFVDYVNINVKAGSGGNGIVAYRREIYEPKGGPAGGDGGQGGNIIFKVDEGKHTLMDFRYNRHFKAKNGQGGMGKGQHGRNAVDLVIPVPPGTIVKNAETGELIADLRKHKDESIIAHGGRGGRGNIRFASARNPAPSISENGEPGDILDITIELKLMADVGLVGFPSVGKSTFLSVVSAAKPKIADYHFTTLTPNLGVVETNDGRNFVMADLPGLIEGAHSGVGLGDQFLKHIERTRIILHVLDMASTEGRDPYEDYCQINTELRAYDEKLLEKPQIILANKMDMPDAEDNLANFRSKLKEDIPLYAISTISKNGIQNVLYKLADTLAELPKEEYVVEEKEDIVTFKHQTKEQMLTITRDPDGAYVVSGKELERLFKMTNFSSDESVQRFSRQLRGMGVDKALRKRGAVDGDTVRILDFEFDFIE